MVCTKVAKLFLPVTNSPNSKIMKSEYIGVSYDKNTNKWQSIIRHNGKLIRIGRYDDEIEAAKAYNQKAYELRGDDAKLNTIHEEEPIVSLARLLNGLALHANMSFSLSPDYEERELWGEVLESLRDYRETMMIELHGKEVCTDLDDYEEQIFKLKLTDPRTALLADELHMIAIRARASMNLLEMKRKEYARGENPNVKVGKGFEESIKEMLKEVLNG